MIESANPQCDSVWPCLLADVGGTNARFAWQAERRGPLRDVRTLACAQHESLAAAVHAYLSESDAPVLKACAVGIANPVAGDLVQMTNHSWSFSVDAMRGALGLPRLLVLNDLAALALALTCLPQTALRQVGGGEVKAGAPLAVLGAGTGLGVSGLMPVAGSTQVVPVAGEGGHVLLCAASDYEAAVVAKLRRRFGHVTAEHALSGPGLVNLYEAVCEIESARMHTLEPRGVSERALTGEDSQCVKALSLFCSLLGNIAGNLALTLGARGGVYIGGGVIPRLGEWFVQSPFRARFETNGRFRDYLKAIPTFVIQAQESPALLGASVALEMRLTQTPLL